MSSPASTIGAGLFCSNMIYLMALGSALLYGAGDFTGGLATRRAGAIPVVLLSQASGLVLIALLLPVLPQASPDRFDLAWGAMAGLTGGIGVALLYWALAVGTMAVVAPTTAVCAVAIPVLAAVTLGERPAPLAVGGIVLGVVSIILVSQHTPAPADPNRKVTRSRLPPGVGIALASGVAIGFFYLSLAQTRSAGGMWPILTARTVSVALFGIIALTTRQSVKMPRSTLLLTIFCGAIDMLANALYLLAAQQGPLSIVVTLSSLYPASTVLLARIVLRERLNLWQISGVACALAAVVLIVRGGSP
jgi:drug/metabolite transporter (DMT)-like permease